MISHSEFYKELKVAFDKVDTKKDGILTRDEIEACLKKLECELPEDQMAKLLKTRKPDKENLTCEEMFHYASDELMSVMTFVMLDTNNDNRIDFSEFKGIARIEMGEGPSEEQRKAMFDAIDKNHDGLISLKELLSFKG